MANFIALLCRYTPKIGWHGVQNNSLEKLAKCLVSPRAFDVLIKSIMIAGEHAALSGG